MLVNLLIRCKNDILHWIQHQVGFRGIWLISSFAVETCQIWRQTTHKSLCFLDFTERWLYIVSGFQLVCKRGDEASRCYWELWIRELVNFSHSLLTGFLQYQILLSLYTDVNEFRDFNINAYGIGLMVIPFQGCIWCSEFAFIDLLTRRVLTEELCKCNSLISLLITSNAIFQPWQSLYFNSRQDISRMLPNRSAKECEKHYSTFYVKSHNQDLRGNRPCD